MLSDGALKLLTCAVCRFFLALCESRVNDANYRIGNATASLNIETSRLPKPPASTVIERLFIAIGANLSVGVSMLPKTKEKPVLLERETDYPSLLTWVSIQPIIFYDATDRRAWLTDGASALLHLARISLYLDENRPGRVYEWVFDTTKFKDTWPGVFGREAALKTLTDWDNLNLGVYVVDKERNVDGTWEITYATLKTRVQKILHAIEIVIDEQHMVGSQNGIRISQTADFRHNILGFDVQDIISSAKTIHARIKHIESRGHGWVDVIPSIGATTIFGRGFGNLIRPEEPLQLCSQWRTMPINEDYMAASVSTLKMLYQQRLLRMEPDLGPGEMTTKIVWTSLNPPFQSCECLKRSPTNAKDGDCHIDSVQFLVVKGLWNSWNLRHRSNSVDIETLDKTGAVIFGHIALLSRKSNRKWVFQRRNKSTDAASSAELRSEGMLQLSSASPTASESMRSARSKGITPRSIEPSQSVGTRGNDNLKEDVTTEGNKKSKRGKMFKKVLKKFMD